MRLLLGCLAFVLLLTPAASRQLTAIRVSGADDLQAAIDAARPGDVVLLESGARFVGNFVLPNHSDSRVFITIRTDSEAVPPEGVRTGPRYATVLATIQSPNGDPALRTAPAAHHWRLENLAFVANVDGNGNIISLGNSATTQRQLTDVPRDLVLDRLYIRGDALLGQRRAIALNSGSTQIVNSYVADIKGVGMDTQAIGGWNGPGPYTIENNYLEGAGENVMFGGGDPGIPNLIPSDITFRRNLVSKPLAWRQALLASPANVRGSGSAMGGTLTAGTYAYRVVAERPAGQGTTALSAPATAPDVRIESSTGSATLEWRAVENAAGYRVYRRGPSGGEMFWRTSSTRFTDTGSAGSNGSPPTRPSVWTVKNLFELKSARNVVVDGNIFENNWSAAQAGYAILLKPVNQDGGAPWTTVENVRFVNNVVRHVASAMNIAGIDDRNASARARGFTIANNLFFDVSEAEWGGAGDFIQIGGGPSDLVIEHNTVVHTGRVLNAYGARGAKEIERFVFRGNLLRHNQYGVKGDEAATGQGTLMVYFPGAVFESNVLAGGDRARYPLGNHFPADNEFMAQFVNPAAGNYRLRPDSPYRAAAGGRDVGADVDLIESRIPR